jgi:hypothetical protein
LAIRRGPGDHIARIAIQNDSGEQHGSASDVMIMPPSSAYNPHTTADNSQRQSSYRNKRSSERPGAKTVSRKTLKMTNPFANPAELEALKRSFAEHPNWKAAVIEGESWEGTTEENIQKWRGLVDGCLPCCTTGSENVDVVSRLVL